VEVVGALASGKCEHVPQLGSRGPNSTGGATGGAISCGNPTRQWEKYIYIIIYYIYILVYIFISPSITGSFPLASLDYQRGISRIVAPFHRCSYSYLTVHEILIPWFLTDVGLNLQGWLQ